MLTGKENVGGNVSHGKVSLNSRLLSLWPMLVLSMLYLSSPLISGGETYNLVVAGILIIGSLAGLMFDSRLRKIARYAFVVGVVIGVTGISPPLYFATVQGLFSPVELALSIACIILTVVAVLKRPSGLF